MSDPMLDGITLDEWHKSLPPSSPGVGSLVVTRAELLALIAAAREDERQRVTSDFAKYLRHMEEWQAGYNKGHAAGVEQGQRDEREAAAQRVIKQGVSIVAGRPPQEYIMLSLAVAAVRGEQT